MDSNAIGCKRSRCNTRCPSSWASVNRLPFREKRHQLHARRVHPCGCRAATAAIPPIKQGATHILETRGKQGATHILQKEGATHILPELVIRSQLNCVCPCDFRQSIPASLRRTRHSSWKQADRSAAVTSATPLISLSAMKASRFSPKTGRADSLGRTTSPVRSGSPPERDSRACLRLA